MKLRLARPATLIDIGRVAGLAGVRDGAGTSCAIGALTRHHDLENDPLVQEHCPILAYTAALVGDRQVRHRGTIGGSLAHGDPASDLPTIALTLDARSSHGAERRAHDRGGGLLPRLLRDGARAERADHRDPGPEDRGRRAGRT